MALSGSVGVRVTVTHADSFFGFDGHVVGLGWCVRGRLDG